MTPIPGFAELQAAKVVLLAALRAGVDADQIVAGLQDLEAFRNSLAQADHLLIAAAEVHGLAERHAVSSVEKLLGQALQIPPGEARRRVRAAAAVGPRSTMLGVDQGPVRPELAAAQAAGVVSPEQVDVVARALLSVEVIDPAEVAGAEVALVDYAGCFAPPELRRIAERLLEDLDPDGARPRDAVQRDLRFVHLSSRRDGMVGLDGRLTPAAGAQLQAVLGPLSRPRQTVTTGPRGGEVLVPDDRTHGQRLHDALEEAAARLLKTPDLPASGGTPATVIITMRADQLRTGLGSVESSSGEVVSVPEALRIAAEAEVIPTVLSSRGRPLQLGRVRRLATTAQTYALVARDGGCSFPGCQIRPEWCDRHHLVPWAQGGTTDVDNLTLLCRYHHTHFVAAGWTGQLDADGLPTWRPPGWADPHRQPLLNHRIRERHRRPDRFDRRGEPAAVP